MIVQFNSGRTVDGRSALADEVEARIRDRLDARFSDRLTRIEVHVEDVDGTNEGPRGIEARIEARPANGDPVAVSNRAAEPMAAVNAALQKLVAKLDSRFGKADRVRA